MSDERITQIPPTPYNSPVTAYLTWLRDAVGKWSEHNFGDQPSWRPAMGMVEEATELYEAIELQDKDKAKDAIGDVVIYMADYYYRRGWDFGQAWESGITSDKTQRTLVKLAGLLCHSHLKGEQGIRGGSDAQAQKMHQACGDLLRYLDAFSYANFGLNIIDVARPIWDVVGKRDWKKNPNNAHEVAEGKA